MPAYEAKLFDVIERYMGSDARSAQKMIGPSGLGEPCYHCLGAMIAGLPRSEHVFERWLAFIGQCVHAGLAKAFEAENIAESKRADSMTYRKKYLVEHKVTVGKLLGKPVVGTLDLYDADEAAIVDWKIVGTKTMGEVAHGQFNETYLKQIQLYGLGVTALGLPVKKCVIMYMPRNLLSLRKAIPVIRPFDPAIGELALKHANDIAQLIEDHGAAYVIPRLTRKPGCRSCPKYGL